MGDIFEKVGKVGKVVGICRGINEDGTLCTEVSTLPNDYCCRHQSQAPPWTRETLRAVVEKRGGSDGLDLPGADLSNLDLRQMDLPRIRLVTRDPKTRSDIVANLAGTSLIGTNLEGAYMPRVCLQGADLQSAKLHSAFLEGANLTGANLNGTDLTNAYLRRAVLRAIQPFPPPIAEIPVISEILLKPGPNMRGADLRNADLGAACLAYARMQEADLRNADLRAADLRHANLRGADLRYARLEGVDFRDVAEDGLLEARFYRARLDRTMLGRDQLGSAIGDELAREYRQARETYIALKQNFDDLGDYDGASWAYRKERRMEKLVARRDAYSAWTHRKWCAAIASGAKFVGDQFTEWLCDYGESIWRVLGWMVSLLFVIGPALFGSLGLLEWPKRNRDVFFSLPIPWRYVYSYFQSVLYTLDSLTTANFAELQPANWFARLLSGLLALAGTFLAGLLGFVAANRIRRS